MSRATMRMLFLPREAYPTDRVRINVLFGRELCSRGHRIDLVAQAADEQVQVGSREWRGGEIRLGPTDGRDGFFGRVRKHWLAVRHDMRELWRAGPERYDIILISDKFLVAAAAALLSRHRGQKFVYWLTFPYPEAELLSARSGAARFPRIAYLRGRLYAALLYGWILKRSDYVFVQSEKMKRDIAARGIDAGRMLPVVTGFDPQEIRPPQARHARCSGATLAYLGTLSSTRRLEVLVDMLVHLRAAGIEARLLLIGGADRPRDRQRLERYAEQAGVGSSIEITGKLSQPQALRRLAEADVCLSPFPPNPVMQVSSPTKLVEYMAMGFPVVANDHPEQRLILRESRAGVRVPWGGRYFARAVKWLLRLSAQERSAMGARGRLWVEAHRTYSSIANRVEEVCLGLLKE